MRVAFLFLAACAAEPATTIEATGDHCGGRIVDVPIVDALHVPIGTPITWASNPPTSGDHFPIWAKWDCSYDELARGAWLHNAEHGGIVFAYRTQENAVALANVARSLPDDPHCELPIRHRAIVVADPELRDAVAAIVWGTYYVADCVDADALRDFALAYGGRATENTCADGSAMFGGAAL
jgi:hypothetical protein